MESLPLLPASPRACAYLSDQKARLQYEYVVSLTPAEYLRCMLDNYRRFGRMIFRPACPSCRACKAIRIRVGDFRPDRSQRRVRKACAGEIELRIGRPSVSREKLALYDRYHAHQSDARGWPENAQRDAAGYADAYVDQPFSVEEWCYYRGGRLIGVGYVDAIAPTPDEPELAGECGLSAIYFFYDPDERERSPGTWNVLSLIDEALRRGLPYVYLGYHVEGCGSMEYKARFVPNERRGEDGVWRVFRE
jgi:arginine-tRNA-protein transferase